MLAAAIPVGTVATASYGEDHGIIGLPAAASACRWRRSARRDVRLADARSQYALHRLVHAVPLLWRLHRIHHTDRLVDLSTALRNHPLEYLLVLASVCPMILLLGVPVWAMVTVELALFASALYSHANIRLPQRWSKRLERVVVTPGFHLAHHSAERREHDSNYGEFITLWDRLFGSYSGSPQIARLGLGDAADISADHLVAQLASPFARKRLAEN